LVIDSRIRIATKTPDAAVRLATVIIAAENPAESAIKPATIAPAA
jgi:hypothetical protein